MLKLIATTFAIKDYNAHLGYKTDHGVKQFKTREATSHCDLTTGYILDNLN